MHEILYALLGRYVLILACISGIKEMGLNGRFEGGEERNTRSLELVIKRSSFHPLRTLDNNNNNSNPPSPIPLQQIKGGRTDGTCSQF